jgi:hypothetical protein
MIFNSGDCREEPERLGRRTNDVSDAQLKACEVFQKVGCDNG